MRRTLLIFIFATFITNQIYCQKDLCSATLKFIKNESFILDDSHQKILIDYDSRSTNIIESYRLLKPPLDNIDLIFISHIHDDHYNKDLLANYLSKNRDCDALMPAEVYNSISSDERYNTFRDRLHIFNQDTYKCSTEKIRDNLVAGVMVPHAAGISDMQNLMFIFSSGGIKFMHSGDYWGDQIDSIKCSLLDEKIDVAMIHVKFLTKENLKSELQTIRKYINPKYIILMHIPIGSTRMEKALNAQKELESEFKNILVFKREMESLEISKINDEIIIK